jgi:hypothetical protein
VSTDIVAMDGSVVSEQKTILDVLEREFDVLPVQQDRLFIPEEHMPEEGWWEVGATERNGGGETTLTLRRWECPKP